MNIVNILGFRWSIELAIVWMIFAALLIHLSDRFLNNETAWTFYIERLDMSCVVAHSRGQDVMFCLPGDRRVEADHE